MSGSYPPEIIVIAEDDANRQIANGFNQYINIQSRKIKVCTKSNIGKGGWKKVIAWFVENQLPEMQQNKNLNRHVVLLIDFDEKKDSANRREYINRQIPPELRDRVFTLGCWDEPEKLKKDLGSYETIGEKLARDCYEKTNFSWEHELLKHNQDELKRMHSIVNPIIF